MTATRLDLKTALIVVDLQKIVASIPAAHPFTNVLENACHLAANFRQHGLPVVLVNVVGTAPGRAERHHAGGALPPDWSELLPELNQQPQDHLVSKKTWGGVHRHRSRGAPQIRRGHPGGDLRRCDERGCGINRAAGP